MRAIAFAQIDTTSGATETARAANMASDTPLAFASTQFLAGGTTLLDLMKLDVMRPQAVIDLNRLRPPPGGGVTTEADGVRLDAFANMADVAADPVILREYPVVAQSLQLAASAQLRNMATLGGNVLQRTRCSYFRDVRWKACNKRDPGSGCAALEGVNRQHAVLGTSERCIATYPGDFAQALIALDATIETAGGTGASRRFPFDALHREPGARPELETTLVPGELITAITIPSGPWTRRSRYVKVRDRVSYQFALASAAVALDLDGDTVRTARIALGGVATIPWRAREAEAALTGKRLDEASAGAAADIAFANAKPREHNTFKVALGKRTLVRALLEAQQIA